MKKIIAVTSAALLGLTLAACGGSNEDAMESADDQNAGMVDDQADAMGDADMMTDMQDDAMVDQPEDTADAMAAEGEMMDETMEDAAPAE